MPVLLPRPPQWGVAISGVFAMDDSSRADAINACKSLALGLWLSSPQWPLNLPEFALGLGLPTTLRMWSPQLEASRASEVPRPFGIPSGLTSVNSSSCQPFCPWDEPFPPKHSGGGALPQLPGRASPGRLRSPCLAGWLDSVHTGLLRLAAGIRSGEGLLRCVLPGSTGLHFGFLLELGDC